MLFEKNITVIYQAKHLGLFKLASKAIELLFYTSNCFYVNLVVLYLHGPPIGGVGTPKTHFYIKTMTNINPSTFFFLKQGIFLKSYEELKLQQCGQMVWKNLPNQIFHKIDYIFLFVTTNLQD